MREITKSIYLGDQDDAKNRGLLEKEGITHILNCAKGLPSHFPRSFRYLNLELEDPDSAFTDCIEQICRFIEDANERGKVLVHCRMGVSRSPSTILAYLCHQGMGVEEARRWLARKAPICPDPYFLLQLEVYFQRE